MTKILPLIMASAVLFTNFVSAADDTWTFFKLNRTTEQSAISVFGTPDIVEVRCSYDVLKNSNGGIRPVAYALLYDRYRGDLNVLKGPLGEASSTQIEVEDGKVIAVRWEYAVKYKAAAEILWKGDEDFKSKVGMAVTIGSKKLPDGNALFVTCATSGNGNCDGPIQVNLGPDPDKK